MSRLAAVEDDEDALLDGAASARQSNSRLSCQIKITPNLTVSCCGCRNGRSNATINPRNRRNIARILQEIAAGKSIDDRDHATLLRIRPNGGDGASG
jgi:hypothetical protein